MRIGFISWTFSDSTKQLMAAAKERGHEPLEIHPAERLLHFGAEGVSVSGDRPDVVITRLGANSPAVTLHLIRQWEAAGVPCINRAAALELTSDKARATLALTRAGLPIPRTIYITPTRRKSRNYAKDVIAAIPEGPWILKIPNSNKGMGVMIAESERALGPLLDTFSRLEQPLVIQAYVPGAKDGTMRLVTIGGRVVAGAERGNAPGDFRTNIAQGGLSRIIDLPAEAVGLAERAALAFGLDYSGVDLALGETGYQILEVNSTPGILDLNRLLDLRLDDQIVTWAETVVADPAGRWPGGLPAGGN